MRFYLVVSILVRMRGLEPPRLSAQRPQRCVSTNLTTSACSKLAFAEGVGLSMTVGTDHSQVFERVVRSIAVLVIKLERQFPVIPEGSKATFFAFFFLQSSRQEFLLDC